MTKWEYETITTIIEKGAPALATDLCCALAEIVLENRKFKSNDEKEKETD